VTANVIVLDNLLVQYGSEAIPIRKLLRAVVNPIADRLWHEKAGGAFASTSRRSCTAVV
jgi:hypothetical protein